MVISSDGGFFYRVVYPPGKPKYPISPFLEIYDRYDSLFTDTPAWRRRRQASNAYLLSLKPADLTVFPSYAIQVVFSVVGAAGSTSLPIVNPWTMMENTTMA